MGKSTVYEAFAQFANDFGYSTTITKDGFSFTDAEGIVYQISLSDGHLHGITEVLQFEVYELPIQRHWQFGNSVLTFNEVKTAIWQFNLQ